MNHELPLEQYAEQQEAFEQEPELAFAVFIMAIVAAAVLVGIGIHLLMVAK